MLLCKIVAAMFSQDIALLFAMGLRTFTCFMNYH